MFSPEKLSLLILLGIVIAFVGLWLAPVDIVVEDAIATEVLAGESFED
ncbi:MAG: hypothetical protein M3R17_11930 [Bacteroidota bacterium]|nr:hypothetical protein [Bacteroidota bacterium]